MLYFLLLVLLVASAYLLKIMWSVYKFHYQPRFANVNGIEFFDNYNYADEKLGSYYCGLKKSLLNRNYQFDDNLVFVFNENNELQYNISGIALYALLELEYFFYEKEKFSEQKFKAQINWLMNNVKFFKPTEAYWEYEFHFEGEDSPFTSCISQGFAISALLRAYQFYNDRKYFDLAESAFNFMHLSRAEKGRRTTSGDYENWYEEANTGSHVLNGHIYSLLGVWDLYRITKNDFYKKNFEDGCATIQKNIADFDLHFSSKYDNVNPLPANNSYHFIHFILFNILWNITHDKFFEQYYKKFEQYYFDKKNNIHIFRFGQESNLRPYG